MENKEEKKINTRKFLRIKERRILECPRFVSNLSLVSVLIKNSLFIDLSFEGMGDRCMLILDSDKFRSKIMLLEELVKNKLKLISTSNGIERSVLDSDEYKTFIINTSKQNKNISKGINNLEGHCNFQIKKGKFIGRYCNALLSPSEKTVCSRHDYSDTAKE